MCNLGLYLYGSSALGTGERDKSSSRIQCNTMVMRPADGYRDLSRNFDKDTKNFHDNESWDPSFKECFGYTWGEKGAVSYIIYKLQQYNACVKHNTVNRRTRGGSDQPPAARLAIGFEGVAIRPAETAALLPALGCRRGPLTL
ncbi:hypothetical protein mRhiFer1_008662 [Rhinolophus ferrumequinum]|uniref:Uncharacterized protein n=1 Tax=Rhinolophus ferrumequinum TaxID=59479 RepID=A0A7J7U114_RHIFE|nr:hypothetical protein mRhiFer1_008662 [Rhinolophus ferrumequinum]